MNFHFIKPAYAAICNKLIDSNCNTSDQISNPQVYFNKFLQVIIDIFMIVGVLYFIWHFLMAGYHFMSSHGDAKRIEESKHEITYAFVGLAVVFSLFAVLSFIGTVFGIKITSIAWPSL